MLCVVQGALQSRTWAGGCPQSFRKRPHEALETPPRNLAREFSDLMAPRTPALQPPSVAATPRCGYSTRGGHAGLGAAGQQVLQEEPLGPSSE
ncbi:hypothetical protein AAY473_011524 [Plecturocebus cupreus]